jgi:hypothetical protein
VISEEIIVLGSARQRRRREESKKGIESKRGKWKVKKDSGKKANSTKKADFR